MRRWSAYLQELCEDLKLTRRRFLAALGSIALGLLTDASLVEPHLFLETTSLKLSVSVEQKLRVAQVTDLHFGNYLIHSVYEAALSAVSMARPDFIAVTGDLVSKPTAVEEALDFVAKLASHAPVYVVPGNWDYWSLGEKGVQGFLEELESQGEVNALVNDFIETRSISVVGVDDPFLARDDLNTALRGVGGRFKLLLAHSPQIIGQAAGRVDVVLAGHTHGGQVNMPLVGPLYVPLPAKYRRYVSGPFHEDDTYMYVCRGLGASLVPVRFMCRPELLVLDLLPA